MLNGIVSRRTREIARASEPVKYLRTRKPSAYSGTEQSSSQPMKLKSRQNIEARSQFCWYLRGVPHANAYKQEVVHVETLDDLRRITRAIQRDLRD